MSSYFKLFSPVFHFSFFLSRQKSKNVKCKKKKKNNTWSYVFDGRQKALTEGINGGMRDLTNFYLDVKIKFCFKFTFEHLKKYK